MTETKITAPGIYDIPAEAYHADPCPLPSLSSSIAKTLWTRTARHAWMKHPRLNPDQEEENKTAFDVGTAAHALLLQGDDVMVEIDSDSYRTNAAKEARDAAYANGKTPLLAHQVAEVRQMVKAARVQLERHAEAAGAFTDGKAEQTLIWQEAGIWCRARLDWLPEANGAGALILDDYKTTTDANPEVWQRRLFDLGFDVQAAWYLRGLRAVLGVETPDFRFVVQEVKPPYALCVIGLTPAAHALGEAKVHRAMEIWRWCTAKNTWPGYPGRTAYVDPPPWEEARFEAAKERVHQAAAQGRDPLKDMIHWQAPLEPTIEEEIL